MPKPRRDSPQFVIDSYRRKQRTTPVIIAILALLLVVAGVVILVIWFTSGNEGVKISSIFPSDTPTLTNTATETPETPTVTPSLTPTETITPTVTETGTPTGPYEYTVQEGDNCWDIAVNHNVEVTVLLALNNFGNDCPINPGDQILIPAPDTKLPTNTPPAVESLKGTVVEYTVQQNDTLDSIAQKYLSTVDDIKQRNEIDDANSILIGDVLKIKVGLVTAVPTSNATNTLAPTNTETATPTP